MTRHAEESDPHDEAEQLSPRVVHYHQTKNGGDLNKIVLAIAGFAVICLVTINGMMWSKMWEMSATVIRLETQMETVLARLPP